MPYDPAKTKNLLSIVGAFSGQPGGEYIADLGNQLKEAETEISVAVGARNKAENDSNRYASELATMQATMRQLREENDALKAAAKSKPTSKKTPQRPPRPAVADIPAPVVPEKPAAAPAKRAKAK